MRFFQSNLAVLILALVPFLSSVLGIPHAHDRRRHLQASSNAAPVGEGGGLLFRPTSDNNTNRAFYVFSLKHRHLTQASVSLDASVAATAAAAGAVSTSTSNGTTSNLLYDKQPQKRALTGDDEPTPISNPHYRLRGDEWGLKWDDIPHIAYTERRKINTRFRWPAKSSPTQAVSSTIPVSVGETSKTASVAFQSAITFNFHLVAPVTPSAASETTNSLLNKSTETKERTWTWSFLSSISSSNVSSTTTRMVPEPASKTVPNAMKPSSTASGEQSTLQGWTENAAMSSSSSTSLSGRVAPASTEQSSPASSSQIRMSLRTETTLPHVLSSVPTTSSSSVSPSPSQNATDTSDLVVVAAAAPDTPSSTIVRPPPIRMGSGTKIIVPNAFWHDFIGASKNKPTTQYWQRSHPPTPPLASNLLSVGVNDELTTDFDLAADTGVLTVDDPDKGALSNIQAVPHLSRDGGKGGYLNGQKLFIFSDTGVYTTPTKGKDGTFLNFVSSSVAIDVGMNPLKKQSPTLEDGIGEWADSAGRMRGFAPLTQGEHSYNLAMQGQGQRYCIWPESSIIPLNHTHALLYAPIVYDNVNRATGRTSFTYTGLTLLTVTTHIIGGPSANRFVDKLFYHNEVEWGSIAGMRSWGPSGIGGNDGRIYVFGKVEWGLLVGRVDASRIDNRDSYEYWNGNNWAASMLDTSSKAYFIDGAMMDADIFYSPRHLTFIIVYLTVWADNTFFYRYLDCPSAIYPQGVPGGQQSGDYAENLVKCPWSRERVLYKAAAGPTGQYIYAGGIQQGYFDADDITNGGYKMLLTWTVPTGSSPGSEASEYSLMSTIILF